MEMVLEPRGAAPLGRRSVSEGDVAARRRGVVVQDADVLADAMRRMDRDLRRVEPVAATQLMLGATTSTPTPAPTPTPSPLPARSPVVAASSRQAFGSDRPVAGQVPPSLALAAASARQLSGSIRPSSQVQAPTPPLSRHASHRSGAPPGRQRSVTGSPPPAQFSALFQRASADERAILADIVAWLTHALHRRMTVGCTLLPNCFAGRRRVGLQADTREVWLPVSGASVLATLRRHFSGHDTVTDLPRCARALLGWCRPGRGDASNAAQWPGFGAARSRGDDADVATMLEGMRLAGPRVLHMPAPLMSVAVALAPAEGALLPDIDLRGASLANWSARGITLDGAYLDGAQLQGADLRRAQLRGASLVQAGLGNARLSKACLAAADLRGARMVDARLSGADFTGAVLHQADLLGADITGTHMRDVLCDAASFQRVRMPRTHWQGCRGRGARWIDARAEAVRWHDCRFPALQAHGAHFARASFIACDLTQADFVGATLDATTFRHTRLVGANFGKASLLGWRLGPGCELSGTQWRGAHVLLDAEWVRDAAISGELIDVVASIETLPQSEPQLRARLFGQLLCALANERPEIDVLKVPSLEALPESVCCAPWLRRLMAAGVEQGGVALSPEMVALRQRLCDAALSGMRERWLRAEDAQDLVTSILPSLLGREPVDSWAAHELGIARCQSLYWIGDGVVEVPGGVVERLRGLCCASLPAGVHAVLSLDGIDAFGVGRHVLMSVDGRFAMRADDAFLDHCRRQSDAHAPGRRVGFAIAASPDGQAQASAALPHGWLRGWRWHGVAAASLSGDGWRRARPDDLLPMLRAMPLMSGAVPASQSLDAWTRVLDRWLPDLAVAACRRALRGEGVVLSDASEWSAPTTGAEVPGVAGGVRLTKDERADLASCFLGVWLDEPPAALHGRDAGGATRWRALLFGAAIGLTWLAARVEASQGAVLRARAVQLLTETAIERVSVSVSSDASRAYQPSDVPEIPRELRKRWRDCLVDPAAPRLDVLRAALEMQCACAALGLADVQAVLTHLLPWHWAMGCPSVDLARMGRDVAAAVSEDRQARQLHEAEARLWQHLLGGGHEPRSGT